MGLREKTSTYENLFDFFCPNEDCGAKIEVVDGFEYFSSDGDTYEFDCPVCGKNLEVTMSISITYDAELKDNK